MPEGTVLWAGRPLSAGEERETRRLVGLLRRCGDDEGAAHLARFLPEGLGAWTPDQLETGAHAGPWFSVGADAGDR